MTRARRLLFVVGCLCCLLAVATALPAADPRLENPAAGGDGDPVAGDWEALEDRPDFNTTPQVDGNESENEPQPTDGDQIEIDGAVEPGNDVTVNVGFSGFASGKTLTVNGEPVAEVDRIGRATVTVPYAEEMTVAVPEDNRSRTVDVATDVTITTHSGAAPDRDLELEATVGETPVANATVTLDGDAVGMTDEDGEAEVRLPETAGPVDLYVARGPVTGNRTVDVAEPRVEFVSPFLFPGSPAPVQVSADGTGVSNATVSLESGGTATTGSGGRTHVWLPIDDEATVTVAVGEEHATATVGNLYLRLTAVVVFVPGFVIGGVVTYFRLVANAERGRRGGATDLFVALADLFGALADALGAFVNGIGQFGWPSVSLPAISLPRLEFGGSGRELPSLGPALSSIGRAFVTLPSLGSLSRSSSGSDGSILAAVFGTRDDDSDASNEPADDGPDLAAAPLAPRGPRAEIRAAWHAFLDRLEVDDRETATPGEVARDALAAGFPAENVRQLVAIVRDVEYGGREASPDRVAAARAMARELLDHEPDEEGSE
ncbi:DUF4129 domain-containing protein [Natrinema altunense]|uniref:Protein-glutamine gamma-glutamyltransferase-like C-terminal domain-containing protein n=1 Tax=Natrinema altunense (strain JCM 12890 / CGMCC 1.3731 / AJ2) TaxID=1227494 RepID=M0A018_NATA2|nr:DUF4129 domain-containing protein [Natrinema altunense]ELY91666.1 hypothetical protein C485_01520 [Natrinema altunense JCM 12890]